MKRRILFAIIIVFSSALLNLKAQFIEDALMMINKNSMITPRAGGLNVAFYGLSDDGSALMYNPAGLGLINMGEISLGLGFTRNSTTSTFLGNDLNLKTNNEYITHATIVSPFKMSTKTAAVGIGYFLENNFDNNIDFSAFNNKYTFIKNQADFGPREFNSNMSTFLWLANKDFYTPIKDSLLQTANIMETGGIHNVTGSIAVNITDFLSVGLSITGKWGTYKYKRKYYETDIYNKYNYADYTNWTNIDLDKLTVEDDISKKISGINGSIGLMARIEDFGRISAIVKFPTLYTIEEDFSRTAWALYDDGTRSANDFIDKGSTSYKIETPFVYAAGISFNLYGLTFSAGVEYNDDTQLQFSDATKEVEDLNMRIKRELVGQTTWGFGLEYELPWIPFVLRTSYANTNSPYVQDIPYASVHIFSIGAGVYFGDNIRLDGLFRWTDHAELRTNYSNGYGSTYTFRAQPLSIGLQFTYRH